MDVGRDAGRIVQRAATSGRVYWLKTATWQVGQRKIRCMLPSSRGASTGCGSPATSSTRSASISRLITNALPVCRWQFRQWQQWVNIGSDLSR
jgi:hypothetical protein